jgi:hypothetical protein
MLFNYVVFLVFICVFETAVCHKFTYHRLNLHKTQQLADNCGICTVDCWLYGFHIYIAVSYWSISDYA